jgi:MFS family permease
MSTLSDVLLRERRARAFLLTYAQSSLGTGAAMVALMVIAYEREPSPWAITAVLLAYDLPPGFLGPLAGAAVDRFSRRWCAIAADLIRACAFVGIALVGDLPLTIAFAFLAGAGSALWSPAALASLPSLVDRERVPAATSVYGGITDAGRTVGPALAAAAFPLIGGDGVMLANGVTFGISALILCTIQFGQRVEEETSEERPSFMSEVVEGLRGTVRIPAARVVVIASTGIILFASMVNVAELPLANDLGVGASGFALLLTAQGVGVVIGSLSGARRGGMRDYERRYVAGAAAVAIGLIAMSVLPWFVAVLATFAAFGLGNGLVVVHERLMFQLVLPERLMGRAYALLDALGAWAFAIAYLIAGATVSLLGARGAIAVAGAGVVLVTLYSVVALKRAALPAIDSDTVAGLATADDAARTEVPAAPLHGGNE